MPTKKKTDVVISNKTVVRPGSMVYCADYQNRTIYNGKVQSWDTGMVIVFEVGKPMGRKFNTDDVYQTKKDAVQAIADKFGHYIP